MLLQIDATLIVIAISFIIFTIIMQKIFYAPMASVREERKNYIDQNEQMANSSTEERISLEKKYEEKLTQARIKANSIVSKATSDANQDKLSMIEELNQKVNEQISSARESIMNDKIAAKETLKPQVVALAHSISTKILGEDVPISGITSDIVDRILNK